MRSPGLLSLVLFIVFTYQAAEAGFDVQLSGHTHGGQIFPGHILMAIDQPFLKGLHRYRNT